MWAVGGEQHKMHQDSTKLAVVLLQDQQVHLQQISSLHNVLYGHGQLDADRCAQQVYGQYSCTVQHQLLVPDQNSNKYYLVLWAGDACASVFHHITPVSRYLHCSCL